MNDLPVSDPGLPEPGLIVRLAAKGDGVTADGRFVARTAPGDVMTPDGSLLHGPHHVVPPCRHFGTCGGCQLQQVEEQELARFVTERVTNAADGQGLAIGHLLPTHLSPPRSRRRATLHAQTGGRRPLLGYRVERSHRIVALAECPVLAPELWALVEPLRRLLALWPGKHSVDVALALTGQGVDCALKGLELDGLAQTEGVIDFARNQRLARLSLDQGYGAEAMWEPEPVTVTLSGQPVAFPSGAFLQATADGEARLAGDAREWLAGSATVADLFAGLGTFAFALAPQSTVVAVEAAREAYLACRSAAARARLPIEAVHRDLFRNPLRPQELARFDAVLLDPPRAGAREQVEQIAASALARVVYISCNPASWARDAARLVEVGFRLEQVRAVGQFRWSTHVELTSLFVR
ncbi:MAG: class I SAM-dependent RNA methyltransferase [Sphingomonadaceae bacterium]